MAGHRGRIGRLRQNFVPPLGRLDERMRATTTARVSGAEVKARFARREDGRIVQTVERLSGVDLLRLGVSDDEARTLRDQLDDLLAPPPPSDELRPWLNLINPTTSLGEVGTTLSLKAGRTYEDVRFLGQIRVAEGVTIRRCLFDGPNGLGSITTPLLYGWGPDYTIEYSEFRWSDGNSAHFHGGGHVTWKDNWLHDNGQEHPSNTNLAQQFYMDAGSGDFKGGLIENGAAFGVQFYNGPVNGVTWDGLVTRGNRKSGIIIAGQHSNIRFTNLVSTGNNEFGFSEYSVQGSGNSVQGDLSGNRLGPLTRTGTSVVAVNPLVSFTAQKTGLCKPS